MSESTPVTMRDLLSCVPEHPVPYEGDVVHLSYDRAGGPVGVKVDSEKSGLATVVVSVPAAEAERSMDLARRAVVRGCGFDAEDPAGVANARSAMGAMRFADTVNDLARQRMFSFACMRTRILPFLAPEYAPDGGPQPGSDYEFQVRVHLRPRVELTSYDPVEMTLPARAEVTEADVDERLKAIVGGMLRWDDVPEEARAGLERLRGQVREQLEAEAENARLGSSVDACADLLAERLVREPDPRYVELMRDEMANRFAANVEAGGTTWQAYTADPSFDMERFKAQMTASALTALRRGLALDALAEHLGIEVTEADILAAVLPMAGPGQQQVAAQAMFDSGQLPQLCEVARRAKAGEWLARRAAERERAAE